MLSLVGHKHVLSTHLYVMPTDTHPVHPRGKISHRRRGTHPQMPAMGENERWGSTTLAVGCALIGLGSGTPALSTTREQNRKTCSFVGPKRNKLFDRSSFHKAFIQNKNIILDEGKTPPQKRHHQQCHYKLHCWSLFLWISLSSFNNKIWTCFAMD